MEETIKEKEDIASETQETTEGKGFFGKYGPTMFLVGFIIYFVLLLIGVIAEIFDIESILDWWIWRPPGKR
jgi:hypothetical protein